jgi:hypothetical protein
MGRCSCINMQEYKWNMKRNQECVNSPLHPLSKLSPLSDPTITSPIDALPPLILSSGQPSSCCRIRIISFPQLLPCLLPLHDTIFAPSACAPVPSMVHHLCSGCMQPLGEIEQEGAKSSRGQVESSDMDTMR